MTRHQGPDPGHGSGEEPHPSPGDPAPGVEPRYEIGPCDPKERAALRAFLGRVAGWSPGADEDRTRWLYDDNPFATSPARPVLVARHDGAIVGQAGGIELELAVDGEARRAQWGIDLVVDPRHAGNGVGEALVQAGLERAELLGWLNLPATGASAATQRRLRPLGAVPLYVRPLDPRRLAAEGLLPAAAHRALPVAQRAIGASTAALGGLARRLGIALDEVDRFDSRVDEVWDRSRRDYRVLSVRDLRATSWRIDDRPDRGRMRRFYLSRGYRTFGYVVLRPTQRSSAAAVVDYLCPRRWVAPLLSMAAIEASRWGAIALTCLTLNPAADLVLRAAGFLEREAPGRRPVSLRVHCADQSLAPIVHHAGNWLVTAADGDLERGSLREP